MKKVIALLLSLTLVIGCLAACSKSENNGGGSSNSGSNSGSDTKDEITIDIYDDAANFNGEQVGWFGKIVKDKFNIKLNIIAPQVVGQDVYSARTAAGNLGDIVILDPTEFNDCLSTGLIKDISADIWKYPNLSQYKGQIETVNKGLPGNSGQIYAIPCEMTNTAANVRSEDTIYSSPLLRWDLYQELGAPEIKDLDGLLDVLKQMKDKHPTNDAGDPAYPFVLWKDWDGNDGMIGIANVVQLTTWYGEKIKGSAILKPDDTFTPITDKSAGYYKILKFLNKGYQMGLVDPESKTEDWGVVWGKMGAGRMYLMWYSWQVGAWNTQERLNDGTAYIFVPVQDQTYYADADAYYGSGRLWGIGSKVDDAKYQRILEFLDWYASPEALEYQHAGIKDFTYKVESDGKYMAINENANMDNLPVPAEYGGAGYQDGENKINQWIVGAVSTNPNTGEGYAKGYWSHYKEATSGKTKQEWQAKFNAAEPIDWMKNNGKLLVSPNVAVSLESDSTDSALWRNQCNQELCDASWKMIFAENDAQFDQMWDEMVKKLDSYHFQDLYNFDVKKHTVEVNAKKAVK
ncbi:MAG: sugar ABC transporter substrate-binding protein [Lachnospiraceae bacterium]|nr:sugar ABC transporter substrate-binding protein [Lachnospiraceae bacterium]MBR4145255.1 sugar ABC transporter substrate-binding protein [Lachnospiraceae bacterium]MBR4781553.1 sugar ABC transporter substrate-binding protein [Lachnospiraceae bacterium]